MSRSTAELMGTPNGLFHWVPGEMIAVLRLPRLPADDTLERLEEQVRIRLNEFLAPHGLMLEHYGTAGRWADNPAMPPVRRRSFIFGLHRKQPLIAIFFHAIHQDKTVRDPLPMTLSYLQGHLEHLMQTGLHLVSAMPNWLITAAPYLYSEGGPALPPSPAPMVDLPGSGNSLVGWHLRLLDQAIPLDTRGAEDVVVAVLDTAHHPDLIRSAATRPELRRNWLLQRLAGDLRNEEGLFAVEYDRYPITNDVCTGRDTQNEASYYFMPDHGLAVAGLIRDMATNARIRLVRVLNDYGGGDLHSLFAALTDLERELISGSIRRLVINLSFTIMPDLRRLPYIWFAHRQWPTTQLVGVIRVLNHIEEGLRLLFESLAAHGALIVAAAGNDSTSIVRQQASLDLPRRPPRAPARYESVFSVTSVNSNFQPSEFANAANLPSSMTGVATFGGDGYGALDANALPDATRVLFISPTFPSGDQNLSGWADWSGTSFSAGIISGLSAHLMARSMPALNVINRLAANQEMRSDQLFGTIPDAPSLLGNIIRIQQRFSL